MNIVEISNSQQNSLTELFIFSLYIVFAYGFYIGQREPFTLLQDNLPNTIVVREVRNQTQSSIMFHIRRSHADQYMAKCQNLSLRQNRNDLMNHRGDVL